MFLNGVNELKEVAEICGAYHLLTDGHILRFVMKFN